MAPSTFVFCKVLILSMPDFCVCVGEVFNYQGTMNRTASATRRQILLHHRSGLTRELAQTHDSRRGRLLLSVFRSAGWVVVAALRMRPRMALGERAQVEAIFNRAGGIGSMAALIACGQEAGVELSESKVRDVWGEGRGAKVIYSDGHMVPYCRFYQLFEHAKRESIGLLSVDDLSALLSGMDDRDVSSVLHGFGLSSAHTVQSVSQVAATPSKGNGKKPTQRDAGDWWARVEDGDWVSAPSSWMGTSSKSKKRTLKVVASAVRSVPKDADSDADLEEVVRPMDEDNSTLSILARLGVDVDGIQYTSDLPSRKGSFALPPRPSSTTGSDPSYMGAKTRMPRILSPIPRPQSRSSRPQSRQSRPGSALSFVERMHEDVRARRAAAATGLDEIEGESGFAVPVVPSGACIGEPPQPFPIKPLRRPTSPYAPSRPISAVQFATDVSAIHPPRCVPTRTTAQAPPRRAHKRVLTPDVLHRIPFDLCPASRNRGSIHAPSKTVHVSVVPDEDPIMNRWLSGGVLRTV